MSSQRNKSFIRLGIIAGIILLALLIGQLTGYLDNVIEVLTAIGLVLIGITILVTVHELGHFLTAKAFGMRVETFSIGFPPKLFGFTRGETEYQIGATPLGGYVKISGIIDESLDTNHLQEEPKPYEFRAKPVWQRLIVMTGGVIMNVILGIAIFTGLKFGYPDTKLPMSQVVYGIEVSPDGNTLGNLLGFQTGDSIISFKGESFPYFTDYTSQAILVDDGAYYEVKRNGETLRIEVPGNVQNYFNHDTISGFLFSPNAPAVVKVADSMRIAEGEKAVSATPAFLAGMRTGDKIIRIDSQEIKLFSDLRDYLNGVSSREINVGVLRGSDTLSFAFTTDADGKMGVNPDLESVFRLDTITYGLGDAFVKGSTEAFSVVVTNFRGIKKLFRKDVDASKSVMGPIQIAKVYRDASLIGGIKGFLRLTAMLSMILAFVNILPIPALDGGHVLFLLIEAVTRKEPSPKVRIVAQQIGMIFILGLMILILFNDAFQVAS
ncbi:MAG: RIP metalloprotease RseP [Bacteroidia bacterium]|nr:RIP metalloprotease RseP [Bacteroidia bacterium]